MAQKTAPLTGGIELLPSRELTYCVSENCHSTPASECATLYADRFWTFSFTIRLGEELVIKSWNTFFSWLVITKNYYTNTTRHFYLDVLVSAGDLHQKKLVSFRVLHGSRSGKIPRDSRGIGIILKIKSRGNSGSGSAFCGSPAGAG